MAEGHQSEANRTAGAGNHTGRATSRQLGSSAGNYGKSAFSCDCVKVHQKNKHAPDGKCTKPPGPAKEEDAGIREGFALKMWSGLADVQPRE